MRLTPRSFALTLSLTCAAMAQAADIKLGVAEALSGGAAQYGLAIRNGFQLAADEINAKGGVNGDKIQLVIEDEQGKKEEAINVVKKLVFQDKVLMVFGPTLSNSMFAGGPVGNAAKTVMFGTSVTANGITDIGPYVFRNSVMESDVLPVTVAVKVRASPRLEGLAPPDKVSVVVVAASVGPAITMRLPVPVK